MNDGLNQVAETDKCRGLIIRERKHNPGTDMAVKLETEIKSKEWNVT